MQAWEKSGDCFRTALHVRPDVRSAFDARLECMLKCFLQDWLLWNRVGATLANSGRSDQALEYYQQALQRNPLYIRARYNMGIALANLKVITSYVEVEERYSCVFLSVTERRRSSSLTRS
jgi:peroxin-5